MINPNAQYPTMSGLNNSFDLSKLMGNPAFMAGLGLLSASRDKRIDPYQQVSQGLLGAGQYQQQQKQGQREDELFGLKKQQAEAVTAQQATKQAALQKVQGLLAAGDKTGAAREAIGSGDSDLIQLGRGLLSPEQSNIPASIREYEYLNKLPPDQRAAYQSILQPPKSAYYSPVQTSTGIYNFDTRTGSVSPAMGSNGQPLLPIAADPGVKGNVAQAESSGRVQGEATGTAKVGLPQYLANAEQSLGLIDKALAHPGKETATGLSSTVDPRNYLAGTDAADFKAVMDQLKGKTFLEAYAGLKGAGGITEIEGTKAENAIARLSQKQSTKEFDQSLNDLKEVISAGVGRMKAKAGGGQQTPPPVNSGWGIKKL